MKMVKQFLLIVSFMTIYPLIANGQYSGTWPDQLNEEDSTAIYALVLYPDSIRISIFEACKYPEAIVRVTNLQAKTTNEFTAYLKSYSKTEQEDIWNLTRYPDLVNELTATGEKSKYQLKEIAQRYPEEIREQIIYYGSHEYNLLSAIAQLTDQSAKQFNQIIAIYPSRVQHAFNELILMPEVMDLLNDHLQMSVLVGDMYEKDPGKLIHIADSLNLVAAQQYTENIEAWKAALRENPDAMEDLKNSTAEYAQENGYESEVYSTAPSEYYIEHYVCYPYPYWFGYPYWYPYQYWYPYPWWYDWGFYYDAFGNIVIIGLPSYYFTYWYFYYPHHYYHHPHLASVYIGYYYGPRTVVDENTNIVHNWVADRSDFLPGDVLSSPDKRTNVIKQIGQMETEYDIYQTGHPVNPIEKNEYIREHQNNYPDLNPPVKENPKIENKYPVITPPQKNPPVKQPPVWIPNPKRPQYPDGNSNSPRYDFNKVNKAQKLLKSGWSEKKRGG